MIEITRKYHFYAAHRNELLDDKCYNLHGHTYRVEATFIFKDQPEASGVAVLFSTLDKFVEPLIKMLDHSTLINTADPLWEHLRQFSMGQKFPLKMCPFDFPTSCENLARYLYNWIDQNTPLPIHRISLAETDSSIVTYKI